jgi:hypothetical protein
MSEIETYLIVGLGNPGREYRLNRHNAGFIQVDALAEHLGVRFSRLEGKALVTKAEYQWRRLILAKPQTYMNLSGRAVSSLLRFYKVPLERLLVTYDDVDLPFGYPADAPQRWRCRAEGLALDLRAAWHAGVSAPAHRHRAPARPHGRRRLCVAKLHPG